MFWQLFDTGSGIVFHDERETVRSGAPSPPPPTPMPARVRRSNAPGCDDPLGEFSTNITNIFAVTRFDLGGSPGVHGALPCVTTASMLQGLP